MEQEAKGKLERQKISDEAEAEKSRKELLELQVRVTRASHSLHTERLTHVVLRVL